jgi:hypothetical protein
MFKTFHQVHFNLSVNGDAFVKYAFMCLLILSFYIFGGGMSIPYYICLGLENLDGFILWGRKHYVHDWTSSPVLGRSPHCWNIWPGYLCHGN